MKASYICFWSPARMLEVTEQLVAYWDAKIKELEELKKVTPPDREDYQSKSKKVARDLEAARDHLFEAILHAREAKAAIDHKTREDWAVKSEDLPWYFPMLRG